ncbi:xaa-Pro aminopeptidase ApepP [Bacillus rossius redtenbacheri]|uniref:xaa-Pro aminopeptidase ApepP n=1 Tax=Bacillus rossius redtenbacheri TaxID=93214 RepID=UPI002FDEC928
MAKKTLQCLKRLRDLMKDVKYVSEPLSAYIITSDDAHQSEYLAECDKRRQFVSGFTGSAGTAVVTEHEACLWTDGRYYLQATEEMSDEWKLMKEGMPSTPSQGSWLARTLQPGARVGADPCLVSYTTWKTLQDELAAAGLSLVPVAPNLVDVLWEGRLSPPAGSVQPLAIKYTGKTSKKKVEEVRKKMKEKGAALLVVTALDEVAWLLNVRGSDIEFNPVFFSYVVVTNSQVHLFVDESKISLAVRNHFNEEDLPVSIHPYDKVSSFLSEQVNQLSGQGGKVWISSDSSYALARLFPDSLRILEITPIAVMKARKNPVEVQGMVNCHVRDAAALCCYFAWLERQLKEGQVVTEISGADRLEEFRKQQEDFMGLSFDTISSVGPNGAIIHYHCTPATDRPITTRELYLCDSGGQYRDGTTDVTRTLHFGTPTDYERECFTRVFKGQRLLGTAIYPNKIKGNCLDTLARKFLWDVGLDYLHGTGHGVGAYLNVHEGPMGISWRMYPNDPGLQEGMFLSNEPGFYEDGKFGIRLENVMYVVPAQTRYTFKDRGFLTFKTVTLVPIQTKLIDKDLLTAEEVAYLNSYHRECREVVGEKLKAAGQQEAWEWLHRETEPI